MMHLCHGLVKNDTGVAEDEIEYRTDSDQLRKEELVRIRFERQALAAVLDYFPIGVIVLGSEGTELHRNRAARVLLGEISSDGADLDPKENPNDLRATIRDLLSNSIEKGFSFHSLAFPPESIGGALQLLQVSLRRHPDQTGESGAVIFLSRPEQEREPNREILRRLYGLTPAEANVGSLLIAGSTIEDAAHELGVSITTARTHLRQLFNKTGTNRQAELVQRLLVGVSSLDLD
jgi:DNA-binding CsgD family transcriptional regulator